jgi:Mn2+/Fe2+ NRAMP family transporter
VAGVILRGSALAAPAGGMGFAIASLGRNTAAALGAGFACIIVLENILGNSLRGWRRRLLLGDAIVFVAGRKGVDVPGRSVLGAGVFLAAVTITLLVAAAGVFKTRDLA